MGVLNWLVAALLRVATRRWPADIRDDMTREWVAELMMLQQQRGTAWRRLGYAFSLAATPLTFDENGEPHGRWEWLRLGQTLRSVGRLMAVGVFGLGGSLFLPAAVLDLLDPDRDWDVNSLLRDAAVAVVLTFYAVAAGRWAGSRGVSTPGPSGSLGVAATAVAALSPLIWFFLGVEGHFGFSTFGAVSMMTACWAVATFVLVVAVMRTVIAGQRTRAWIVVVVAAPVISVLPAVAYVLQNPRSDDYDYVLLDMIGMGAFFLLPWTVCAAVFGWATAHRWLAPVVEPAPDDSPAVAASVAGPVRWWRVTAERIVLGSLAAVSAVVWALGVTVLQPLSEPEHLPDATGENNTYWARELRWGALIALILVLLVYVRGDRRGTRAVVLGGVAWLAVDIGLDRINLYSGTIALAIGAALTAVACCAAAGTIAVVPRPGTLFTVALTAAVLSGMVTMNESPTDTEPALNPSSAAVGALLALVAVVAAVRASATVSRVRAALAVPVAAAAAGTPFLIRYTWPYPDDSRFNSIMAFTMALVLAVVVLSGPRPRSLGDWLHYPAAFAVTAVALPVVMAPLIFASMVLPVGAAFTALAGNPPIHGADTDSVYASMTIPVAVVLGWLLRRLPPDRPLRRRALPTPASPPAIRPRPLLVPPDPS